MSKKVSKKRKNSNIAKLLKDTKELLKDWSPPFICNNAIRFILGELDTDSLLNLCLLAIQQGISPQILSGFRLDKLSVNDSIKTNLTNRLIPVLYESEFLRAALFIISYPQARWYRWSEILEGIDEDWIIKNWRHLFRLTKDASILISMVIDSRKRITKRGRRLLTYNFLFKELNLIDMDKDDETKIKELKDEIDQFKHLNKKSEQKKRELKKIIKEKDKEIKRLNNEIISLKKRIKDIESSFEEKLEERLAYAFEEIYCNREVAKYLWQDILFNKTDTIKKKVEKALNLQAKLDLHYGTKDILKRELSTLNNYLKQIEFALSESIYPSKELINIKELIKNEIDYLTNILNNSSDKDLKSTSSASLTKLKDKPSKVIEDYKEPYEIANISSFVLFNKDICKNTICIVDGYNAIKSAYSWAKLDKLDFKLARKKFSKLWKDRAKDWNKVELVFDGKGQSFDIETHNNLTFIFTDSRYSSQGADTYIFELLKELSQKEPDITKLLITADSKLRAKCKEFCNYFADPRWALITYLALD